jgi:hypothetical protein
MFVYLEDAWHPIGDNEHTPCGIVVPPLTPWERKAPEPLHCGPNAAEVIKPKAKGKKK